MERAARSTPDPEAGLTRRLRLWRCRRRIVRLERWHHLHRLELAESGDPVAACRCADRGGPDERDRELRLLAGELAAKNELLDEAREQLLLNAETLRQADRMLERSKMLERDGGIRLLIPTGTIDVVTMDGGISTPVETGYREVFVPAHELRAYALERDERMRAGLPPLLIDDPSVSAVEWRRRRYPPAPEPDIEMGGRRRRDAVG